MTSELRSDTARINGAKSHGPKTPETRAISAQNALKHGFTSHHTILLACEDPAEFQRMLADFMATYRPVNSMQKRMVEEMFGAHWRIRRLKTIETSLFDYEMVRQEPALEKKLTKFDVGIQMAVAFAALADESRALSLLSRYEARLHRIHDRTLRTLLALRQGAKPVEKSATPLPPEPEIKNDESNPAASPEPVLGLQN